MKIDSSFQSWVKSKEKAHDKNKINTKFNISEYDENVCIILIYDVINEKKPWRKWKKHVQHISVW